MTASSESIFKVERIDLTSLSDGSDLIEAKDFYEDWKKTFPSSHPLHNYNAKDDPETALSVIYDAFAFTMKWLPRDAMQKIARMAHDPNAPSALVLQGFPIGDVPPTPVKSTMDTTESDISQKEQDRVWASVSTHVPVAETWLLGVGRLLGTLQCTPMTAGRGGLVNDMIPVTHGNFNEMEDLRMHRDFARQMKLGPKEAHFFVLFCVRGDPDHNAKTVLTDSNKLWDKIDPQDKQLLLQYPIQVVQKQPDPSEPPFDYGEPVPVLQQDKEGRVMVNLVNVPYGVLTCPTGGQAVLDAYHRVEQMAWEYGDKVDLQKGDMLILNNCRLVHGRTAYKPKLDGTDRWLVKCYVNNQLWGYPGTDAPDGQTKYPKFRPSW